MISTKVPDGLPIPQSLSDCHKLREDITHQYKYPDGNVFCRLEINLIKIQDMRTSGLFLPFLVPSLYL